MFATDRAPLWADGDNCCNCLVQFSFIQRKHHCRACGEVFCGKCSSRSCPLPKFGIETEVRVCDACWVKHIGDSTLTRLDRQTAKHLTSKNPPGTSEEELKEEEDLHLAIALSKSEAEEKERMKLLETEVILYESLVETFQTEEPGLESENPELARYMDRAHWETKATAPSIEPNELLAEEDLKNGVGLMVSNKYQNGEADSVNDFALNLRDQTGMLVNHVKLNSNQADHTANDIAIQAQFMNVTTMHSQPLQRFLYQNPGYNEDVLQNETILHKQQKEMYLRAGGFAYPSQELYTQPRGISGFHHLPQWYFGPNHAFPQPGPFMGQPPQPYQPAMYIQHPSGQVNQLPPSGHLSGLPPPHQSPLPQYSPWAVEFPPYYQPGLLDAASHLGPFTDQHLQQHQGAMHNQGLMEQMSQHLPSIQYPGMPPTEQFPGMPPTEQFPGMPATEQFPVQQGIPESVNPPTYYHAVRIEPHAPHEMPQHGQQIPDLLHSSGYSVSGEDHQHGCPDFVPPPCTVQQISEQDPSAPDPTPTPDIGKPISSD